MFLKNIPKKYKLRYSDLRDIIRNLRNDEILIVRKADPVCKCNDNFYTLHYVTEEIIKNNDIPKEDNHIIVGKREDGKYYPYIVELDILSRWLKRLHKEEFILKLFMEELI